MITHANKTAWPDALALSTTLLSFLNLEMDWLLKVGENATQLVSRHDVFVSQGLQCCTSVQGRAISAAGERRESSFDYVLW
jgi:hypothetical protein